MPDLPATRTTPTHNEYTDLHIKYTNLYNIYMFVYMLYALVKAQANHQPSFVGIALFNELIHELLHVYMIMYKLLRYGVSGGRLLG